MRTRSLDNTKFDLGIEMFEKARNLPVCHTGG